MALSSSVSKAIRLVVVHNAGDGLDWTFGPYRYLLSSQPTRYTLDQQTLPYLRIPKSANFESKLSDRALMWWANCGTPRSSYLYVTYVLGGTSIDPKTHEL